MRLVSHSRSRRRRSDDPSDFRLRGFEDLVQVPFQELRSRPVHSAFGKADDLPSHGVELIAVAEVFTQPRTNLQAVFRVDAKVPAVEQGVDIGSEQQAVVEPVLAAKR